MNGQPSNRAAWNLGGANLCFRGRILVLPLILVVLGDLLEHLVKAEGAGSSGVKMRFVEESMVERGNMV